jgi:hypothetical protein
MKKHLAKLVLGFSLVVLGFELRASCMLEVFYDLSHSASLFFFFFKLEFNTGLVIILGVCFVTSSKTSQRFLFIVGSCRDCKLDHFSLINLTRI